MAKVTIDASTCTGCGLCVSLCADGFEMGDDNIAKVTNENPSSCDMKEIASQCPVNSIKAE